MTSVNSLRRPGTRTRATIAAAVAGLVLFTACSPANSNSPVEATAASTATADANEAASEATAERETITITDELGREVELQVPIQKVYPNFYYQTEIVRAIGATDAIVAVDDRAHPTTAGENNADYFGEFAELPIGGTLEEPDWETIANSGAEVFLAMRNSPWQDAETKLAPFGIKVVVVTSWDPEVLREQLPTLGKIFGKEEGAAKLAQLFDDIDADLEAGLATVKDKKTVYFENNADNTTSVPGSGWHDVIVKAGGENIFGDINAGSDQGASVHSYVIDPVVAIERNPDVIVRTGANSLPYGYESWGEEPLRNQAEAIANRPGWSGTTAVQNGDVYTFNNFFFSALGKQIGAIAAASWLYPEQFSGADVDGYFARWLELQGVEPRPATDYYLKLGD